MVLVCQQKMPAPSKVNGTVMVDVTGVQPPVVVGTTVGVRVRVGEAPMVWVGVLVIAGVNVRVGVLVRVAVWVGEAPTIWVGVTVTVDVLVRVGVGVGVLVGPLTPVSMPT